MPWNEMDESTVKMNLAVPCIGFLWSTIDHSKVNIHAACVVYYPYKGICCIFPNFIRLLPTKRVNSRGKLVELAVFFLFPDPCATESPPGSKIHLGSIQCIHVSTVQNKLVQNVIYGAGLCFLIYRWDWARINNYGTLLEYKSAWYCNKFAFRCIVRPIISVRAGV